MEPKWMRIKGSSQSFPGQLIKVTRFTDHGSAIGWVRTPMPEVNAATEVPTEPTELITWEMGIQEITTSHLEDY